MHIYVAIDVHSLWVTCRNLYGPKARVNFSKLKEFIHKEFTVEAVNVTDEEGVDIHVTAYMVVHPTKYTGGNFLEILKGLGFEIRIKELKYTPDSTGAGPADWSVGIAYDILSYSGALAWDDFVLIVGEKDYRELSDTCQILTFDTPHNRSLYGEKATYLPDDVVYR